jgi:long-chain acyl-CoA synthetase/crotonobetaine/carnitine-CoA ligase
MTHPGEAEIAAQAARLAAMPPGTVDRIVADAAAAWGDRPAAVWFEQGRSMSFAELDRAADRLAAGLLARGLRKGAHVAVMLPNVPEWVITWFALARLGAVMVPVNAGYTGAELDYILNAADVQALVIDESALPALDAMARRPAVLAPDFVLVRGTPRAGETALDEAMAHPGPFAPPTPVTPADLASLQFTSGTTGFPKGCMLSQDYWWFLSSGFAETVRGFGIARTLIWAPFFYMDPQWMLLASMQLGATSFIADRMSLTRFMGWVREHAVDYTYFPEAVLKATPEGPGDAAIRLRYINAFGWSPEGIAEAERRWGCVARDCFGMTEIGAGLIVPVAAPDKSGKRSCGIPAAMREARVVDEAGRDVPDGTPGELWIRGRSILWGYYRNPAANAAAFRGAWFRTGDLFVRDTDGYHHIVGRLKDMIRRSGENIAAREVEEVASAFPGVVEAAAVPVPDPLRNEEVKVYLRLAEGLPPGGFDVAGFLAHCAGRLAAFKVPRFVAFADSFPRTPSQKIAKPALVAAAGDLRAGAWDRVEGRWHPPAGGQGWPGGAR